MIRDGDVIWVFQQSPFEGQKVIIAAAPGSGKVAADLWANGIDGAGSCLAIEESADRSKMLVVSMANDPLLSPRGLFAEFFCRLLDGHVEVRRKASQILFGYFNNGIRAAIGRATATLEMTGR